MTTNNVISYYLGSGIHMNFHAQFKTVSCMTCRKCIAPNELSIQRHIKNYHEQKVSVTSIRKMGLASEAELENLIIPTELDVSIPHINVLQGKSCNFPNCNYICKNSKVMRRHASEKHVGFKVNPVDVLYQVLKFNNDKEIKIKVSTIDTSRNTPNYSSVVSQLTSFALDQNSTPDPDNCKIQTAASYFLYLEKYMPFGERKRLNKFTKNLPPQQLKFLQASVFRLYLKIQNVIRNEASEMVRKKIMEPEIGNMGKKFLTPLQNEQTIQKYSQFMTNFLIFTLECSKTDDYKSLLAENLRDSIEDLFFAVESFCNCSQDEMNSIIDHNIIEKIQQCIVNIFVTSYDIKFHEKDTLIYKFCLSHSIQSDGKFLAPSIITQKLAALKHCARGTLLRQMYIEPDSNIVEELCEYLDREQNTPFGIISRMSSLLTVIAGDIDPISNVFWLNDEFTELQDFQGNRTSIDNLSKMAKKLIFTANQKFMELTAHDHLAIPQSFKDNIKNSSINYSFQQQWNDDDAGSEKVKCHVEQFFSDNKYWFDLIHDKVIIRNISAVKNYMNRIACFQKYLALILHICAGSPARGTEYEALLYKNNIEQLRSLFFSQDMFMVLSRYDKARNICEKDRLIPRFLPKCVHNLFAGYFIYIRPVEAAIAKLLYPDASLYDNRLFIIENQPLDDKTFRDIFTKFASEELVGNFGISTYRQIVASLMEKHCSINIERETNSNEQFGHTVLTGRKHYGRDGSSFGKLTADEMLKFRKSSLMWHKLLGLHDIELNFNHSASNDGYDTDNSSSTDYSENDGASDENVDDESKSEERGTINSSFNDENDLNASDENVEDESNSTETGKSNSSFYDENASDKNVEDVSNSNEACSNHRIGNENDLNIVDDASAESNKSKVSSDLQRALDTYCGQSNANFSSESQRSAIHTAALAKEDSIIVLPTGGGKSLSFFLPAIAYPHQTNIVIVPLKALLIDLLKRARDHKINCCEWIPGVRDTKTLVFVSAENMNNPEFRSFAQKNAENIKRIFVDEAHLFITWNNFRPQMNSSIHIAEIPCPLYLLTATLPPTDENILIARFSMEVETTKIIRTGTDRPELIYNIQECMNEKHAQAVLVKKVNGSIRSSFGKAIVFCRSKRDCHEIASRFTNTNTKFCLFHGDLTPQEKEGQLQLFKSEIDLMIATTALSYGVDITNITKIFHYRLPFSISDYAQACGRGGRRGEKTICTVLTFPRDVDIVSARQELLQLEGK